MNPSNKLRQGCWVTHRDFGRGHVIGYGSTRGTLAIQFDDHQVTHVLPESTLTLTKTPPPARVAPAAVNLQTQPQKPTMALQSTKFSGGRPVAPAKKPAAPAPAKKGAAPAAAKPAAKPAPAKKGAATPETPPAEKPAAEPKAAPVKSVAQELRAKLKDADTATAITEARAAGVLPTDQAELDQFLTEFMEAGLSGDYPWLRKRFIAALVARAK